MKSSERDAGCGLRVRDLRKATPLAADHFETIDPTGTSRSDGYNRTATADPHQRPGRLSTPWH